MMSTEVNFIENIIIFAMNVTVLILSGGISSRICGFVVIGNERPSPSTPQCYGVIHEFWASDMWVELRWNK